MRERSLPIAGVGKPAPFGLVATLLVAALVVLLVAAVSIVVAADDLAAARLTDPDVLLAVHLLVLGFLPLGIAGAVVHVLPLLLRGAPHVGRGWIMSGGLLAGPLVAVGIARHATALTVGAGILQLMGLALLLGESVRLAVHSPRGRIVVASRTGVVAAAAHAALGLMLGPLLFHLRWRPWAGIPHERLIGIHLTLAVVGSVTLLVVAVGRTLLPMLAVAPVAPRRRLPVDEVMIVVGTWTIVVGLAMSDGRWLVAVGGASVAVAVARFVRLAVVVLRSRRVPAVEGPLLHALVGLGFLVQAVVATGLLVGRPGDGRLLVVLVVSLLLGWSAGITVGHAGKLLALSAWTWWPPGPRPKQAALYAGRLWIAEVALFGVGTELLVIGVLAESAGVARSGGVLLVVAACLAVAGATRTLALSPDRRDQKTDR